MLPSSTQSSIGCRDEQFSYTFVPQHGWWRILNWYTDIGWFHNFGIVRCLRYKINYPRLAVCLDTCVGRISFCRHYCMELTTKSLMGIFIFLWQDTNLEQSKKMAEKFHELTLSHSGIRYATGFMRNGWPWPALPVTPVVSKGQGHYTVRIWKTFHGSFSQGNSFEIF